MGNNFSHKDRNALQMGLDHPSNLVGQALGNAVMHVPVGKLSEASMRNKTHRPKGQLFELQDDAGKGLFFERIRTRSKAHGPMPDSPDGNGGLSDMPKFLEPQTKQKDIGAEEEALQAKGSILFIEDGNIFLEKVRYRSPQFRCNFSKEALQAMGLLERYQFERAIPDGQSHAGQIPHFLGAPPPPPHCGRLPVGKIRKSPTSEVDRQDFTRQAPAKKLVTHNPQHLISSIMKNSNEPHSETAMLEGYGKDRFLCNMLYDIQQIVIRNLECQQITAGHVAAALNYTQRSLCSIVREATGMSLVQYILMVKLVQACRMILNKEVRTINEARYAVGIDSVSYFNKKFKQHFGISPNKLKQ